MVNVVTKTYYNEKTINEDCIKMILNGYTPVKILPKFDSEKQAEFISIIYKKCDIITTYGNNYGLPQNKKDEIIGVIKYITHNKSKRYWTDEEIDKLIEFSNTLNDLQKNYFNKKVFRE